MVAPEKIYGTYIAVEIDETEFSNHFELKIYSDQELIKFDFIMKTEGNFGSVGKNWYGKGIFRADHLVLIVEMEKDWTYIKSDDDYVEHNRPKNENLPVEIYTDEDRVVVYHIDLDRYILMNKIKNEKS